MRFEAVIAQPMRGEDRGVMVEVDAGIAARRDKWPRNNVASPMGGQSVLVLPGAGVLSLQPHPPMCITWS